jgi:flagellar hook-basal body complex protein FliE
MSIPAIGAITPGSTLTALAGLAGAGATTAAASTAATAGLAGTGAAAATSASGALFGTTLAGQVDGLQALQSRSDELAIKAVTGDLDDIHDYTIAASEASVAMELTTALRNKAVEAFTEIMRMQA